MTDWSPKQEEALSQVARWMRDPSAEQVFYMAGFAGTGKTTLAKHLVQGARRRWLFAAYTGKAAHVLRQKGCGDASTIHSLIYRPAGESKASEIALLEAKLAPLTDELSDSDDLSDSREAELRHQISALKAQLVKLHSEREPMFALWANSPLADPDVEGIIVDECSMVDDQLGKDLESFGKKILAQGDPAQLPPVGACGRYTKRRPDIMLTEIHRQARESGILRLATKVRNGESFSEHDSSSDCMIFGKRDLSRQELAERVLAVDQVLVGKNKTRRTFNHRHRELLGIKSPTPVSGDRLVCLRNDKALGLFNGSQWSVTHAHSDIDARTCDLEIESLDGVSENSVQVCSWLHHMIGAEDELSEMGWNRRDFAEFDYGYAMTVHKAQGSQWGSVMLFDESGAFGRDIGRRWLYTGITRAAKTLTVML